MELIKIGSTTIGAESKQTVNARELHAFLEVGKDFSNWIKDRIGQYEFVEGNDYVTTLAKTGERKNVVMKDYHITLDMAKELSMVERNAKGKQARQYFIECERRAKSPAIPQDPIILMRIEQLAMQGQVAALESKTSGIEMEQESINDDLEYTKRQVRALQAIQPKLTLGMVSNPITLRLHSKGMTVRQWATKNGFEYTAVRNVISGLSQKEAIKRALDLGGLLSDEEDLF